jgi:predicted tellurium resistance membrane protein TerC
MFDIVITTDSMLSLFTLSALEIVLGIDNIVIIAIISNALPAHQRDRARVIGLALALITRLLLLFSLAWIASLTKPLFHVFDLPVSGRDLIMLAGGLFLIVKATREIHDSLEEASDSEDTPRRVGSFRSAITQIVLLDIVFSFDSVITAVGMANDLWVMAAAVIIAVIIMLIASGPIVRFIHAHPSIKMLALAFVMLIGVALVAEGMRFHIPKGYLYAAMAFSVAVEALNITLAERRGRGRARARTHPG